MSTRQRFWIIIRVACALNLVRSGGFNAMANEERWSASDSGPRWRSAAADVDPRPVHPLTRFCRLRRGCGRHDCASIRSWRRRRQRAACLHSERASHRRQRALRRSRRIWKLGRIGKQRAGCASSSERNSAISASAAAFRDCRTPCARLIAKGARGLCRSARVIDRLSGSQGGFYPAGASAGATPSTENLS